MARSFFRLASRFVSTSVRSSEFYVDQLERELKGVAVFRMNRPAAKNAISRGFLAGFRDAINSVKHNSEVRVVVIKSDVPNVFCAGADLKERAMMAEVEVAPFIEEARRLIGMLEDLPQPVLAAMDGVALGGGLELALAADLRIAADTAKMGLVETKLAIIPGAGGTQRLPRLIGVPRAKELIFTGRVVDGCSAYAMGLVDRVVPAANDHEAAYKAALEVAKEILPQGPIALKMAKLAINKGIDTNLLNGLEIEKLCYAQVIPTKDRIEGLRAFKEKRTPIYTGN